jgi:3-keto-5-aminohexanoate cleavage enzyme
MSALPYLMVAPNGARRTKADHPALPLTLPELVTCAGACAKMGADGIHVHLRDAHGGHLLDAGLYQETLAELRRTVPQMALQITTEAVGLYDASAQRAVALNGGAPLVSASVVELHRDTPEAVNQSFYQECADRGIALQHILYSPSDFVLLKRLLPSDLFHSPAMQLIFVLGRYSVDQESDPQDLMPYLETLKNYKITPDWAICAFGRNETACLLAAHQQGGKLRVGFENSLWNADGLLATDNAARVEEVARHLRGNSSV